MRDGYLQGGVSAAGLGLVGRFRAPLGWAAGVVCSWLIAGCASLGPAEREALVDASALYSRGQTASAAARLDPLIRDFSEAAEISEAYYVRGLCRFRNRELQGASEDFEQARRKSRRADLTARCRASLATIAYQRGDWKRAADSYEAALPDLPDQPPKDQMLYAAGEAMQRCGRWRQARLEFAGILHRFRDRPIAADARRMAGWNHEYYSIQLGVYQNVDNAARAVRDYREKGLVGVVQENQPRDRAALWVVMAGRYPTYADARSALDRVRRIKSDACIIP